MLSSGTEELVSGQVQLLRYGRAVRLLARYSRAATFAGQVQPVRYRGGVVQVQELGAGNGAQGPLRRYKVGVEAHF